MVDKEGNMPNMKEALISDSVATMVGAVTGTSTVTTFVESASGVEAVSYTHLGKNYPEKIATIVSGVAEGCKQSGCALVGGETAEHPGLMPEDCLLYTSHMR